jgi:hypothetical protein
MKKIIALLFIIFISYSFEDRMRCFDDLDGSPTEKCYVYDAFNELQYFDSCKNVKFAQGLLESIFIRTLSVQNQEM